MLTELDCSSLFQPKKKEFKPSPTPEVAVSEGEVKKLEAAIAAPWDGQCHAKGLREALRIANQEQVAPGWSRARNSWTGPGKGW